MRGLALIPLLLAASLGCGGSNDKDMAAIEKRLKAVEKQVDQLSRASDKKGDAKKGDAKKGDAKKGDAKKGDAKAEPKKGKVEVSGDADKVQLAHQRARMDVPGAVPAGTYKVFATFGGEEVEAGQVTVVAGKVAKLTCRAAQKKCQAP